MSDGPFDTYRIAREEQPVSMAYPNRDLGQTTSERAPRRDSLGSGSAGALGSATSVGPPRWGASNRPSHGSQLRPPNGRPVVNVNPGMIS